MPELTPQAFSERWGKSTLSEKASAQSHFIDLCRMLGKPTPAEADPDGDFYTFEKGVEKTGGGKGFADVWYRGRFAIEYKGKHKDLTAAYQQLLQYREALENPPVLMVTDIERFEIHTNFTGTITRVYGFKNEELPEAENLRLLRAMFTDPYSLKPTRTVESVTEEAAGKFARLADGLRGRGVDPQEAAHFLNKLLFCLFAEDIKLLPEGVFTRVVTRGVKRPETFNRNVRGLFEAMSTGGEFSLEDIPHFDGGLFSDGDVVPLEAVEIRVLAEASRLDWSSVEPAIFGTLFERSLDPSLRARLGAHYTSKDDILTIVEPVLMAPLRREWEGVRARANSEAEKAATQTGRRASNTLQRAERELSAFAERLRRVSVLDPACGSGNFLYVSLKELLDLEKEVSTFAGEIGLTPFFPEVSPEQLHGIETSPYAHELAQVAIWIGYLQWLVENGFGTRQEPILGPMTNIVEMDALLTRDEDGNPTEPDWPEADVIVGNPPFLGGNRVRAELKDEYLTSLFKAYMERVPAFADLVCYWFEKARGQIVIGKARRVGLLATNSIRGGVNRRVVDRIKLSGDIFFAESDRPWVLNGAAVRVSMVGFDDGSETSRTLNGVPVARINADLTAEVDLSATQPLIENRGICFFSIKKGGPFEVTGEVARRWLDLPVNPNGRPNSDVVRPWYNGLDVARRPRDKWIIDFGPERTVQEAALYEAPFEHVRKHVKPIRDRNRRERRRRLWWLFSETAPGMRRGIGGLPRFLVTPAVSTHHLLAWLDASIVPDQQLIVFARDDDYFFGMLQSRVHKLWAVRKGTFQGVGNDPRYTPSTCFETFPLPWPPGEEPQDDPIVHEISAAAKHLDELRRNWLDPKSASEAELKKRTLTNLYNQRPSWLENAHARLDRAVFAAYGWPPDLSDEEVLQNVLALNLERSDPHPSAQIR